MDKELTIQDLEAQADALLAAADEMEELLPADTGKSKRKKAEDEAPEKKAPPLDEKVLAGLPAAEQLQKSEKLRDLFAKGKQKGKQIPAAGAYNIAVEPLERIVRQNDRKGVYIIRYLFNVHGGYAFTI